MSTAIKHRRSQSGSQSGFTLVETIFYAAGIVILLAAMVTFLFYMFGWYRSIVAGPRADRIGVELADRIVKELRTGTSVQTCTCGSTSGAIDINSLVSGAAVVKKIHLSSGRITYQENTGATRYLSPSDMTVARFYLYSTTTAQSTVAVRFDIDLSYQSKSGTQTNTYSGLAVMRQSY